MLEALGDYTLDEPGFRLRVGADALEILAGDGLEGLNVAQGRLDPNRIGDRGDRALAGKTALGEPAAEGLLVELALVVAAQEEPLVAIGKPIAARVGAMELVGEDEPAVGEAEFVFVSTRMRPERAASSWPRRKRARAAISTSCQNFLSDEAGGDDLGAGDGPIVAVLLP